MRPPGVMWWLPWEFRGRRGAGWGDHLAAAPRSAWSGRIVIPKPARSYTAIGQQKVSRPTQEPTNLQNWQSTEDRHSAIIALAEARPGLGYEAIGAQFGVSGSCVSQTISRARKASRDVFLTDLTGRTPGDCALAGVMFFAAWLLHSIRLAAALAIALLAMQAPAITREY
jgi:hypothetical protein